MLAVVLVCLVPSCGDSRAEPPGAARSDAPSGGNAPVVHVDAPAAGAPEGELRSEAPGALLALEGEGLRVFSVPSGSARPVPFGTAQDETLALLTAVLRMGPRDEGEQIDCRAEYATWENGLTTWFVRDGFVGWSVPNAGSPLTTASGVGVGSTRAELESAYVAEIRTSTLGVEFAAGGLAGLLESRQPSARITNLWAGQVCVAR